LPSRQILDSPRVPANGPPLTDAVRRPVIRPRQLVPSCGGLIVQPRRGKEFQRPHGSCLWQIPGARAFGASPSLVDTDPPAMARDFACPAQTYVAGRMGACPAGGHL
jgi:hypothetical protein